MLLEEKYKIPLNKQDCTKFVFKVLPEYLELKERKKLKEQIENIKVISQISDEDIPNFINEEYMYKTIMLIEIKVKEIKKLNSYIEILHRLFKAPTIIKITDIRCNYLYSFSLKRLNKNNTEDIITYDIINTEIYDELFSTYKFENFVNNILNQNNKYEYYYELMLKNYIEINKKYLSNEILNKLSNSKIFYNIDKMVNLYTNLKELIKLYNEYEKSNILSQKIELKKEIDIKLNLIKLDI